MMESLKRLVLLVFLVWLVFFVQSCTLLSGKWGEMSHAERLAATIQDARQTAAAIRWVAPIAEVVVAGSCPECVAGYRAASASYQALSLLVDRAAFDASENPNDAEAQQKVIDLTAEAKAAWADLDAAYKGNPEPITEAGEEMRS